MLKPVQFLKPRNVNGPLYQPGDIAGFMPELAAQLIADGTAVEHLPGGQPAATPATPDSSTEVIGALSGYPQASSEDRHALRGKKPGGKK